MPSSSPGLRASESDSALSAVHSSIDEALDGDDAAPTLLSETTRHLSLADIAVQSSTLSPLDTLYKQIRARKKAEKSFGPPSASVQPATGDQRAVDTTKGTSISDRSRQQGIQRSIAGTTATHGPLPVRSASIRTNQSDEAPRASVMSSATIESTNGDPFHYEAYTEAPTSFEEASSVEEIDPYLSRIPSVIHPRSYATGLSPQMVGYPASSYDERFQDGDASTSNSPALSSTSGLSPAMGTSASGRFPSHTSLRNYSRPSSATTRSLRSDSNASSIAAGTGSSLGHSSSSHTSNPASLSSSWDHRNQFEMHQQEALERHYAGVPAIVYDGIEHTTSSSRFSAASTVKQGYVDQRPTDAQYLLKPTEPYAERPISRGTAQSLYSDSGQTVRQSQASTISATSRPVVMAMHKAKASLRQMPDRRRTLNLDNPSTAEEFLQAGINEHESGDLGRAAYYFSQSAQAIPPCAGGMLMYGLTLRHGWGCPVDAEAGFRYIQAAAECISDELDRAVAGGRARPDANLDARTARNELILALHEIGTSLRFGWGIKKDKQAAVAYFKLAADMGDMDAQQDLAFCYANGKGCKKSMKLAAKYYRLAIAQGAPSFGLSWVFKSKWDD